MGFLKKIGKKLKKGVKKLGKGLKKGVKKLAKNIKKHGPTILGVASMFIPGGVGGLLGKVGGAIGKVAPKLGGFIGGLGNLGHGTGLFGKEGGFLSGQGALSQIFGGTGGGGFSQHPLMQMFQGGGEGGGGFGQGGQAGGLLSFLDPSGDGLFDPTSLGGALGLGNAEGNFAGFGGGGSGLASLLAAGLGGGLMGQQADPTVDVNQIMSSYDEARGKHEEMQQYYKDLADPESTMNRAMLDTMQERGMDQAAMASLQAERMSPGGITSGMQAEQQADIYDKAGETAQQNFQNYMSSQAQMGAQGVASSLPFYEQMGNEQASFDFYNQQAQGMQDAQESSQWNQIGTGLLDYGIENIFGGV